MKLDALSEKLLNEYKTECIDYAFKKAYVNDKEDDIKLFLDNDANFDEEIKKEFDDFRKKVIEKKIEKRFQKYCIQDKDKQQAFLFAIVNNDLSDVRLFIKSGVNIDKDILSHMWWPTNCNPQIVRILMDNGADVSADGDTSLIDAIEHDCSFEVVKLLVDSGANVNAVDEKGDALLLNAIKCGYSSEIIQLLVNSGANVNAVDEKGNALLLNAIKGDYSSEIIQLLINSGANVNAVDKNGDTLLLSAIKNNCSFKIIKLLFDKGSYLNINAETQQIIQKIKNDKETKLTECLELIEYTEQEIKDNKKLEENTLCYEQLTDIAKNLEMYIQQLNTISQQGKSE